MWPSLRLFEVPLGKRDLLVIGLLVEAPLGLAVAQRPRWMSGRTQRKHADAETRRRGAVPSDNPNAKPAIDWLGGLVLARIGQRGRAGLGRGISWPTGGESCVERDRSVHYVYWVIDDVLAGRAGPEKYPWDLSEIGAGGIGGIVSLAWSSEEEAVPKAGLKHLPVFQPMVLLEDEEDRKRFLACMPPVLKFVDECRAKNVAVLVHCHHGNDRTGTVLACYLVARENLSATEAVARIRELNPAAMSAFGYAEAVTTFEQMYQEDPSVFDVPS